jgi:hypothetical protein
MSPTALAMMPAWSCGNRPGREVGISLVRSGNRDASLAGARGTSSPSSTGSSGRSDGGILRMMDSVLHFAGNFWWLIFPLGGMIGGGVRAVTAANERRAERRLERYRIKQQTKVAVAEASGRGKVDEAAARREVGRVLQQHDRTDARWLDYEMDVAKLLDFPLMTDMREPLTAEFHRARSRADLLRPASADDLAGDRDAQLDYREAVHAYVSAFDVAESEAIRRRRSDFSTEAQERLERAQRLLRVAADSAATPDERRNAYSKAQRELDGLLVLPAVTRASIERRVAGELEA